METLETSPMTPLRFKLDEPLAIKAAWLNASRYNLRIALFVLTVALLTSAFFVLQGGLRSPERIILQVVLTVGGSGVLGVVVVVLMRAVFLPMQVRKNLRQQKALSEEMPIPTKPHPHSGMIPHLYSEVIPHPTERRFWSA